MYKVFYNQKPVNFVSSLTENSPNNPLFFIKYSNSKSIIKALNDKKVVGVNLYHPKEEKIEKYFFKIFPIVEAAGGLVEHNDGRFLFIYRNNKWDLPKGKIDKKEKIIDAAIREVIEETGVSDLTLDKPLTVTFHIFKANKKYKLKKTHWFLMKSSCNSTLTPQIDENITKAEWKTKEEIPKLLENAYKNLKLIFDIID